MMEAKHTPAPWWVDDYGMVASGHGDEYVTVANPLGCGANAALIAGAPEMLDALLDLVTAADYVLTHGGDILTSSSWARARAVIGKMF